MAPKTTRVSQVPPALSKASLHAMNRHATVKVNQGRLYCLCLLSTYHKRPARVISAASSPLAFLAALPPLSSSHPPPAAPQPWMQLAPLP